MEEDNSLEYEIAEKVIGSLVRAGILAAGAAYVAYVSAKTGTPADKVLDPNVVTGFADSATSVAVAVLASVVSIAFGVWEKVTTAKKVRLLKADIYELKARRP